MKYLFIKELKSFFTAITGYVVAIIFLTITGLFLWIFPSEYNIPESGYAALDPLFTIAPWVFLFLIPAVTMRTFAEEKNMGTLDLLFTKPLTEWQIILSKYFAALTLILIILIPTLAYMITILLLGSPVANIDFGGTWGSYIGLIFLAGVYAAAGVFASSLTNNQIIAFLLALLICFFLYMGFEFASSMFGSAESLILKLGINEHYKSMSRGVIDSRNIIYFICVNAILLASTKLSLDSRTW